ncbi:MAG: Calx-beta domain-containing protein, partial [Pseudomonadota bacterium]
QTPSDCGFDCTAVSEIPTTECQALVAIHNDSSNSEPWNNNTGWLETNTPCNWHGVTCGGGHVTRLYLYHNNLTHALSSQIDQLTMLEVLRVEHNKLCGTVPSSLMNLEHLWYLNIDHNHLTATDPDLRDWLNNITPDWELTQTPCSQEGTLQFSLSAYSTSENGGQAIITVTRTGDSNGAASIDYATTDDTATAGSDYTATIGTLNWANQNTVNKTFTVDIIDDSEHEGDETFIVSLGNAVGAELGSPNTSVVTITDEDTSNFCETVTGISESECEGLVAIYNSTNGEQWDDNTNWTVTTTPCDWYGVTCSNGKVTRLYLYYNNLSGSLPAEIGNLVNLKVLRLEHNEICGEVPSSVTTLEQMLYVNLNYNHLTATDPVKQWLEDHGPWDDSTQSSCP